MDQVDHTQDKGRWRALVNALMNIQVVELAGNLLTRWGIVSFSGRNLLHEVSWLVGW
jgi:hypothetical protein